MIRQEVGGRIEAGREVYQIGTISRIGIYVRCAKVQGEKGKITSPRIACPRFLFGSKLYVILNHNMNSQHSGYCEFRQASMDE